MQQVVEREFMRHLRRNAESADLARLRRGVAEPGAQVVPLVEVFVARLQKDYDNAWERQMLYLVAGLWAGTVSSSELEQFRDAVDDEGLEGGADPQPTEGYRRALGHAIAQLYLARSQSPSIEQRFVALLDADREQLPYRLRQMVQLLKGDEAIRIHWGALLRDLLAWNREGKPVQQTWARAFYRTVANATYEGEES
ncbi:type I-E CRISPR-associated protein Cse2/CasB [Truepera radiovictrix]|uniref:CRISPR-associated protein, Cse2 family n=1 Tax=Truepera radiovictrix (strain DSM 17093 / CIP 108686 / LMG 22925 / RQ-24) TaxID=649638 RepID=D7CSJ9_TRURR|nr:type I-E CRISPR-associated protein Cse2/CasB [Truepera radiovictrix]ADI15419.1 CRISPR-associated protein, Cse2 family [Truepera radiovictrix DSM 17093]WMT56030.1 type I-E CRISPR-associated protein Cse2/CasB [Truepera radiovictrix]